MLAQAARRQEAGLAPAFRRRPEAGETPASGWARKWGAGGPPALLLNADFQPVSYRPLSVLGWQDAVRAVFQDRVQVVESWDVEIRSPSFTMKAPSVVALRAYQAPSRRTPAFTRHNLYLRDDFRCQYCGARHETKDLSFDHVHPASLGGRTVWDNIVAACLPCNFAKGSKTLKQARMSLRRPPRAPTAIELFEAGRRHPPGDLFENWRDYLYWTVELEEA